MRGHHSSLVYLRALLKNAKSEIASDGHISEEIRKKIFWAFCFWDCLFALTCLYAGPPEAKVEGQPPDSIKDKQADKKRPHIVAFIDERLERLSEFEGYATEREELVGDAEARSFSLPPTDATDKLLRYEAHLDRQLYRAMEEFVNWTKGRFRIALATSATPRNRQAALHLFGLSDSFDFVVDASGFSHPKPDPEIFQNAARGLRADTTECLVIEDSLNGVVAGKAAGCHVVAITTSFAEVLLLRKGADHVVHSFQELRRLLDRVLNLDIKIGD
jgi:HAD superfamily hydrolase (TIGR01509 family)